MTVAPGPTATMAAWLEPFASLFTRPTWRNALVLAAGAGSSTRAASNDDGASSAHRRGSRRSSTTGRGPGRRGGTGSGVIIARGGLVLTNSHLAAGARRVPVALAKGGGTEAGVLGDSLSSTLRLSERR